jgi:hypothetical protein
LVEVVPGGPHLPYHFAGVAGEHLASFRWHHTTRAAGKKRLAYFLFELPQLLGDRRWRVQHQIGRSSDGSLLHNLNKQS